MNILVYAIVGAVVALIPFASFLLVIMELIMLHQIARQHGKNLGGGYAFGLVAVSGLLKGLATLLHTIPVIGQIANSLVAFGFILLLGKAAESAFSE